MAKRWRPSWTARRVIWLVGVLAAIVQFMLVQLNLISWETASRAAMGTLFAHILAMAVLELVMAWRRALADTPREPRGPGR